MLRLLFWLDIYISPLNPPPPSNTLEKNINHWETTQWPNPPKSGYVSPDSASTYTPHLPPTTAPYIYIVYKLSHDLAKVNGWGGREHKEKRNGRRRTEGGSRQRDRYWLLHFICLSSLLLQSRAIVADNTASAQRWHVNTIMTSLWLRNYKKIKERVGVCWAVIATSNAPLLFGICVPFFFLLLLFFFSLLLTHSVGNLKGTRLPRSYSSADQLTWNNKVDEIVGELWEGGRRVQRNLVCLRLFIYFFLSLWFDEYENERRFISGRETLALAASAGWFKSDVDKHCAVIKRESGIHKMPHGLLLPCNYSRLWLRHNQSKAPLANRWRKERL